MKHLSKKEANKIRKKEHELVSWCMQQAQDYKEGKLTKEQIKKLKAIKFPFDYYIKNRKVN